MSNIGPVTRQRLSTVAQGPQGLPGVDGVASALVYVTSLSTQVPRGSRDTVIVDGYAASGDGGGGTFNWNATDTRADNGGTILAVTGVPTGRWSRESSGGLLDVRWFGADQTGTSDSTAAIQNALNAPSSTIYVSRRVYAPTGVYPVSSTISIPDHTEFFGDSPRYLGPGSGGQFGTILRWTGGTGTNVAVQLYATSADIRGSRLRDIMIHGNFGVAPTANSVTGLLVAGSGGAGHYAVSNCYFDRVVVAEFNTNIQWGTDGGAGDSQADSIQWVQCESWYANTYGMVIDSANAGDSSELVDMIFNGRSTMIGVKAQAYGFMKFLHCQGDNIDTLFNVVPGNELTIENCETESCNWFLDVSGASDDFPIHLVANTINNGVRCNAICRIVAIGNVLAGIAANGTTMNGLVLGAGARWIGTGNRYLPNGTTQFLVDTSAGGIFDERDLPHAGGLYDQEQHTQGQTIYRPAPMYGVGGTIDSFAFAETCSRTGIRGIPWAASTVTAVGTYVVAVPDDGHVYRCTGISSDDKTGLTQPSWDTGSGHTTADNHVTWTEAGPSSLHELVGPPGMLRSDTIPTVFCRQGTVVWKRTVAADQCIGWIAIANTQGAVATDWRSFGQLYGSDDGASPYLGAPLRGSIIEGSPLSIAQNSIALSDADYPLTATDASQPHLSFSGALTADRTITFPTIAGFEAAPYVVQNNTTGGHNLILTGGGLSVTLPPQTTMRVEALSTNVQPVPAYSNAQPSRAGQLTDSTGGTPGGTLAAMTGTYSSDYVNLNSDLASLAAKVNALELLAFRLGQTK